MKNTSLSLRAFFIFAVGLGVWSQTFGEKLEVFYVESFLLPSMLVYIFGTREFWISSLKERDGQWSTEWRKYLAAVIVVPFLGASSFVIVFGFSGLITEVLVQVLEWKDPGSCINWSPVKLRSQWCQKLRDLEIDYLLWQEDLWCFEETHRRA